MVLRENMAASYLFQGLPPETVERVAALSETVSLAEGVMIHCEEQEASDLFIVLDGAVELSFAFTYHARTLSVLYELVRPGELFGWSALTAAHRYTADARTQKPTTLARFNGAAVRAVMDDDPAFGYQVMTRVTDLLSHRLRDAREQLRVLLQQQQA